MKRTSMLTMVAMMLFVAAACTKDGIHEEFAKPTDVVNPNPPLPPVDFTKTSLGELAAKQGILLGAAFTHDEYFQNDSVPVILKRDFKAVTFGNEMKQSSIMSTSGKLKFTTADEMAGWADAAGTKLFGHVLGWHQQQQVTYLQGVVDKAAADNSRSLLQTNWNFEDGLNGYSVSGFGITSDHLSVFAGEASAVAEADDATLSFTVPVEKGNGYELSFWAKAATEGKTLTATTGDKQKAKTEISTDWIKYTVGFNVKSIGDYSYLITAGEGVIIDNIRVVQADVPEGGGGESKKSYLNPHSLDPAIDFESYEADTPGSRLVSDYGWSQINGGSYVTVAGDAGHSGAKSLVMDNASLASTQTWDIQCISPKWSVEAGKTYRIAWYSRASAEADLQIDIREDGSTKAYKSSAWGNYDKSGTDWTYQYYDYTVEEGAELSVAFYGATETVCYWLDDIQVFEAKYDGDYTNYIDAGNLLAGADIEDQSAWGVWNGASYVTFVSRNEGSVGANKEFVHSAVTAIKVDNTGTGWTGGSAWHIQIANNSKIPVTAGKEYRIGMWIKSPDGGTTIQYEAKWDSGDTNYKQLTGITSDWQYLYQDITAPEGAAELQFVLDCAYEEVVYCIDDIQIYPKPVESCIEPSSVVDDGDFEAYGSAEDMVAAGWQINGASSVSIVDDVHHGARAVRMDNADGHAGNAWDIQIVSRKYAVEGGRTYRIQWQGKADAADVDMQIDIRGGAETKYASSQYSQFSKTGTDWTTITYDYTAEVDQTEIQVGFYGGVSANVNTIDCFQIYPVAASEASVKADAGYGRYCDWEIPAATSSIELTSVKEAGTFETTDKLDDELASDALDHIYKNWVYAMVEHFDVYAWDVMNEVFTDDGNFRSAENTTGDDIFIWGTYYGGSKNFTDKAFAYATAALEKYGKTADLYINDYNLETSASKRAAFCKYATGNAQVTGVGTQMHLDMAESDIESKIESSLKELAATGKKVRISELDIKCTDTEAQASLYKYIFEKYIELVPEAQRGGITFWGINDKDSWLGESCQPLLWKGKKYEKKPAYETLYVYLCELAGINPYSEEE